MADALPLDVQEIQKAFGVIFRDPSLLEEALTHPSYINENPIPGRASYQRLEFLGDAALGLIVAQDLYRMHPDFDEGQLTELRSALVRRDALARVARRLAVGTYLLLGKGEEQSGGRQRAANLAATLEALIGAVLQDQGWGKVRTVVRHWFQPELARAATGPIIFDSKSGFQRVAQSRWHLAPIYRSPEAVGPAHARVFTVEVALAGQVLGVGRGPSKRAAAQKAARQALNRIEGGWAPPQPS
ncbi:MAG TPA: ribonuclease III [Dehalococcoidia bacterium]|nr:ribonuclease III [Dehalococcoidia bacterium]